MSPRLTSVQRHLSFSLLFFLLLLQLGCGGGGGGGRGSIVYSTIWGSLIGSGQSQYVALRSLGGSVVASGVLNRSSGDALNLTGIASGEYLLHSDLYQGADATGTKLGQVEKVVTISGATAVRTNVGATVAGVQVTPTSASLLQQQTKLFYASAISATGELIFAPSSNFAWSVLGGVGSTSQTGLFKAETVGVGSVRATYSPGNIPGSALVNVSAFTPTAGKWTILVFLNAANDLDQFSKLNVNQMEKVATNPNVRFVVQWKHMSDNTHFTGTRRYLVKHDTSSQIKSELVQDLGQDVDMGSADTLREFIEWGKACYPADHYVLVVWNHGSGWNRSVVSKTTRAVSYDDEMGTVIQTWELPQALGTEQFDIIAWDASLMQMLEVAYEVKDNADYVAGSEESPPGEGYPYDLVFQGFMSNPDAPVSTLARGFVDGMLQKYSAYPSYKITQSIVDTSKLPALATAVDHLGSQLISNLGNVATQVQWARTQSKSYSPSANRYYRDIYSLMQKLKDAPGGLPQSVSDAATGVQTALNDAVVYEGHNNTSAGSTGLSIDFTPGSKFGLYAADYEQMKFGAATNWNEWLLVSP